jgi:allantoin racemase
MLKILWINPVGTALYDEHMLGILRGIKRPDVEPFVTHLEKGPDHLEYHYYEHLVADELLRVVRKAESDGFDAVVIGCFYDPSLREARELVSIPVVAPAEACLHVASTLGHKFSIIVGRRKWIPKMEGNVWLYGLEKKLASFREVGFSVRRMMKEPEKLKEAIIVEAEKAIKEDGAEVIILGCTAESGFMKELSRRLGVPVLDPVVIAWKYAEMLADLYRNLGVTHSKLYGYEPPPIDEGWLK